MTIDELIALYQSPDSVPPLSALSGLDEVDWSAVRDAYGPATGVPGLLRALTSLNAEHREYAIRALFQHVLHQGTVYSATAATVPILYELLQANGPHNKSKIAYLLGTIADGKPPFFRCENDPAEAEKWRKILSDSGQSLDAELEEGRRYAAEIRSQIARQFDVMYPYLRDPNPETRHAVAIALRQFPEFRDQWLREVEAVVQTEPDDYVRNALKELIAE